MNAPAFPSPQNSVAELLNCIRILSRMIPFVYELQDNHVLEHQVFWLEQVYLLAPFHIYSIIIRNRTNLVSHCHGWGIGYSSLHLI